MRYVRILLLNFEQVFEYRSRVVVWFLIGFVNSLIYFIFWKGSLTGRGAVPGAMHFSDIASYYLLLIIAGAFLQVHIEDDVAYSDIQLGGLSRYLVKPFSYFRMKFLEELPWRLAQGVLGVIAFFLFTLFFGSYLTLAHEWKSLALALVVTILAYCISFTYKMTLGILTLWFTDYQGLHQLDTVILFIFAGFVVPIEFLPNFLHTIATYLPFAYMIYYPVRAFQGLLTVSQTVTIIEIQCLWLILLFSLYSFLWRKGTKEFTGVGQ